MSVLPIVDFNQSGDAIGRWWSTESDGRILCRLCPRACRLKPGDRGFCFVRANRDGKMVLDTYGRSTGFCIDPIEKKPLNHFLPGTPVLSFGTAGCNLGCKFCQNWDISKSREVARLSDTASPQSIARAAISQGCRSVAFTYNDPVIWAEYAIDTAAACRSEGVKTVAVTAGYITPEARGEFFAAMDAANIDLKGFTEEFYYRTTGAHLDPVLDTIRFACRETDCWVELTNLIIPDANDDGEQLRRMCDWILEAVGSDVPVHFTAFHPDFRMMDRPRTPDATLVQAYDLALQAGLRYVYVGNIHDVARQSTYCPSCRELLIERDWHQLGRYTLDGNRCRNCQFEIAGHFESHPGSWGQRRQPIRIGDVNLPNSPALPREPAKREAATVQDLQFDGEQRVRIHRAACQIVFAAVCRTELAVLRRQIQEGLSESDALEARTEIARAAEDAAIAENKVLDVTIDTFADEVLQSDIPVIADFWAPWCGPCKAMAPVFEELAIEYESKAKFVKINTEEEQQLAAQFRITSIPTLLVFHGGQLIDGAVGALPRPQLQELIERAIQPMSPAEAPTEQLS